MDRDMDRLREVLWEQFEKAVDRQPRYEDFAGSSATMNFAIEGRTSIGTLALAIVATERELRETDERANGIRLPGK